VAFQRFRNNARRNRNANSALGEPRAQVVYYGVWLTGIAIGVVLMLVFAVFIGNGIYGPRTQQTARENQGADVAPFQVDYQNGIVPQVDKWEKAAAAGDKNAQAELKAALSRGQANYQRICIGCHFGPPEATSNGPWLGNLYQTAYLYNGKQVNDANVVTFILLGSQSHNLAPDNVSALVNGGGGFNPMPAGIATPLQAVDIMLYLKQQTSKKS
jgi:cytochrome c2